MVSAAEIRGEESLRTWIHGCTPGDAHQLAVRAALRVAPFLFLHNTLPATVTLRLLLTLCLAAQRRTEAPDERLTAAYRAFRGNGAPMDANGSPILRYPGEQIVFRCISAAVEARENVTRSAEAASHVMVLTNEGAIPDFQRASLVADMARDAASIESGGNPFGLPLWRDDSALVWVSDAVERLGARGPSWVFWADWYEGYLTGNPLVLDLLQKVAEIEPEHWDKGDDHVNGIIAAYYRDWQLAQVIRQNPYAVTVSVDARQRKLVAAPVEPRDLADIIKATRAALRDFEKRCANDQSHNRVGLTVLSMTAPVLEDLKRDLTRYRKFPVALFEAIEAARNEFLAVCAREGLSQESAVSRLSGALQTRAQDVCVADPAVLETVRKRMDVELTLLTRERIDLAVRLCRGMGDDSAGWLKDAAALAVTVILDPGRSESERRAAWYFIKAVVPRGAQAVIEHSAAADAKASKRSKLDQVVDAADKVYKLDKGSDAIQEAIADNSGWVSDLLPSLPNWLTF